MLFKVAALLALTVPLGQLPQKGTTMHHAAGTFEVSMKPLGSSNETGIARMSIDKTFHGGIEGTSQGEMMSSGNPSTGSAGYVALEKVTGKLDGAEGSFVLQHTATMDKGAPTMSVSVVPGSGTGSLEGLAGKLDIQIAQGKHSYSFEYTLQP